MAFEWDPAKAQSNRDKHGVAFAEAATVFLDPHVRMVDDDHPAEARFVGLGVDAWGRVLVVAWTWRGERIRLISARRATPAERRTYLEQRR